MIDYYKILIKILTIFKFLYIFFINQKIKKKKKQKHKILHFIIL